MKIKNPNKPNKKVLIGALISILLAVCAITYAWWAISNDDSEVIETNEGPVNVEPAPATLNDEDAAAKKEFIERETSAKKNSTTPSSQSKISIETELSDASVIIKTSIANLDDGICKLRIESGNSTYTDEAPVIYQPTFSTCGGFSVSKQELPPGTWIIAVDVIDRSQKKISGSANVEVK